MPGTPGQCDPEEEVMIVAEPRTQDPDASARSERFGTLPDPIRIEDTNTTQADVRRDPTNGRDLETEIMLRNAG